MKCGEVQKQILRRLHSFGDMDTISQRDVHDLELWLDRLNVDSCRIEQQDALIALAYDLGYFVEDVDTRKADASYFGVCELKAMIKRVASLFES